MFIPKKCFSFIALGFSFPDGSLQSIRIKETTSMVDSDTGQVFMSQESDVRAVPADDPQFVAALGQSLTAALARVGELGLELIASHGREDVLKDLLAVAEAELEQGVPQ